MEIKDIKDKEIVSILKSKGLFQNVDDDTLNKVIKSVLEENAEIKEESIIQEVEETEDKKPKTKINTEELLEYNKNNILVVKEKYKYNLKAYDLSLVDWTGVDIRDLDLRNTNPDKLDPQKVHNRDFSGVNASSNKKENYIVKKEWDWKGVKLERTNLYCEDEDDEIEVAESIVDADIDYESWKNLPRKYQKFIIQKGKLSEDIIEKAYEELRNRETLNLKEDEDIINVVVSEELKGISK